MLDKIAALFKQSTRCQHKHTFDVLFTVTDDDSAEKDYLLTVCTDCKKLVAYTDLNSQIKQITQEDILEELKRIHSDDVTAVIKPSKTDGGEFLICDAKSGSVLQRINFQHGNNGINGVTSEDLLSAVLLRMQTFQKTNLKCKETDEAMLHIKNALTAIERRNKDREKRNVKGTMNP